MEEKKIRPQDRWNAKAGLISKSYKLKREVTEQFAKACEEEGVSQAGQITKMMKGFINRKEIEKEYAEMHSGIGDCLVSVNAVIFRLKKMLEDVQSEELKIKIEERINEVFIVKDNLMEHNKRVYDFYNKIWQQVDADSEPSASP